MRLASIDIGTNALLLLIADIASDGTLSVVHEEQILARLGKGVDANRRITAETFHRVLGFLQKYQATAQAHGAVKTIACATSALRDASNRNDFVRDVKERAGLEIKV